MGFRQCDQMPDRPGDDVATAVEKPVSAPPGGDHAGDVPRDAGLLREDGDAHRARLSSTLQGSRPDMAPGSSAARSSLGVLGIEAVTMGQLSMGPAVVSRALEGRS